MSEIFISDERMLLFMDYCIENEVAGITMIKQWCEVVGIESTNIPNIRSGKRGFNKHHLHAAATYLGVSMDYLFGFTDDMLRTKKGVSSMQLLKAGLRGVEQELIDLKRTKQGKKKTNVKR